MSHYLPSWFLTIRSFNLKQDYVASHHSAAPPRSDFSCIFQNLKETFKINKLCTIKNYIYLIIRLAGGWFFVSWWIRQEFVSCLRLALVPGCLSSHLSSDVCFGSPVWVSLAVTFTHVVSSQKVCLTWTLITEKWLWKQTETCVLYTSVMLWSYLWRILKQTVQKWCSEWRLWDIRSGLSAAQCCKHQVITGDSSASAAAWKKNVMMMKKTVQ